MLSVVGRLRFLLVLALGICCSTLSAVGLRLELEYRILCMYARALTEASTEFSMMAVHFGFGISRNERAVWRCTVSFSPRIPITHGRISMV